MHPSLRRYVSTALGVLTLLALAGCGSTAPTPAESATTAAAATSTTPDLRAEALRKSEESVRRYFTTDWNQPLVGDFVDPKFAAHNNEAHKYWEEHGVHAQVKALEVLAIQGVEYRADPLGTTVLYCGRSNVRLIDSKGRDVTVDDKGVPIPDKPRTATAKATLTTKDNGVTWQVSDDQPADTDICPKP